MTGAGDGRGAGENGEQERLAGLCGRLDTPGADRPADAGWRALAEELAARIRAGRPPGELEDVFDEVEELLLAAGHSAGLGSYRAGPVFRPLPGTSAAHPALYLLACPGGHCPRLEVPDPDGPPPHCRVLELPLRAVGLRP